MLGLNEQVQIPQQVMDIRVGEFLTQIRETIVRIRQLESEVKNITPDFQPCLFAFDRRLVVSGLIRRVLPLIAYNRFHQARTFLDIINARATSSGVASP